MAIVLPPNSAFEPAKPLDEKVGGSYNGEFSQIKKDPTGRILAYSNDHILPRKGLIYPAAARHNNIMKAAIIFLTSSLGSFRPTIKWLDNTLRQVNKLAEHIFLSEVPNGADHCEKCGQHTGGKLVRTDFMKFSYYNACSQELWHLTHLFLKYLGCSFRNTYETGRLVATVLEYEPPYRMRGQDIFSAINQNDLIKNPRKELKRVFNLYIQREKFNGTGENVVSKKFSRLFLLFSLVLLIPKFKNAFIFAVKEANWDMLRMDEIDVYWAMLDPNYDTFGLDIKDRREAFKNYCNARGQEIVFQ